MAKRKKAEPEVPKAAEPNNELGLLTSKDIGELPFDKAEPLEIKYTLFGKERDAVKCAGSLGVIVKVDQSGRGLQVLSSVMGVADADIIIAMLQGLIEHTMEVLEKLGKDVPPSILELTTKKEKDDLALRMAASRASGSKAFH